MYLVEALNGRLAPVPLAAMMVLLFFLWCARGGLQGPKEPLDALVFLGTCVWMADTLRHVFAPRATNDLTKRTFEEQRPFVSGANA